MPKIWISAGEYSGDMQAASLLTSLQRFIPELQAVGMGGPNLENAGQRNLFAIEQLSVMGIAEVATALPRIGLLLHRIRQTLQKERPDAVILTDCPDFHFRVASMASSMNIPVYYFIPPKVWAWRTGRIRFLQRHIRKIFCILPFEKDFYEAHGISVEYVGNPLVGMVNYPSLKHILPQKNRIGLMPGSRKKEIERHMPLFSAMADQLQILGITPTFSCFRAPNIPESSLLSLWTSSTPLQVEDPVNRYQAMRRCELIVAASGTAVLETALAGVPTLVTYKVSPLSGFIGRLLIKSPYVSLPNLILRKAFFEEFLLDRANPKTLAMATAAYLQDSSAVHRHMEKDFETLRRLCGDPDPDRSGKIVAAALKTLPVFQYA